LGVSNTCDWCAGTRFDPETLELRYKSDHIASIFEITVAEALDFFQPPMPIS